MGAAGQDLRALEGKLQFLLEASSTLLASTRIEELLPNIRDLASQLIDAEACAIWQFHGEDDTWRIISSVGLSSDYRHVPIHQVHDGTASESPYCFEDVSYVPVISTRRQLYDTEGI